MGRLHCLRCGAWRECPALPPVATVRCDGCGEVLFDADPPAAPGAPPAQDSGLSPLPGVPLFADRVPRESRAIGTQTVAEDVRSPTAVPGVATAPAPASPSSPVTVAVAVAPAQAEASPASAIAPSPRIGAPPGLLAPPASPAPLGNFGRYEILEEVGRGGMGVVYRARQSEINRIVALKVLLSGKIAGDEEVRRFQREAAAAASLSHPGIVAVHDVGIEAERHFFTMDFIEGKSLARLVRESGPLAPPEALRIVRQVAEAVQHAHTRGIIHRDLKPDNIILRPDGRPVVTDFGLAKPVSDTSRLTATGILVGTLVYMSPEQASGDPDQVGPLSDVYSLGAVLYELLTGRPPFEGSQMVDLVAKVLLNDPVSPKSLRPGLSSDIQTICLKALAKEPTRRYPSAQAFADDIGRYLGGESIVARPTGALERAARKLRRYRAIVGTVAAAALLLVGVVAFLRTRPGTIAIRLRVEDRAQLGLLKEGTAPEGCVVEFDGDGALHPVDAARTALPPGRHTFRFAAPDYHEVTRTVDLSPSAAVEVPVDLLLRKGTVAVRVSHEGRSSASPDVVVRGPRGFVHALARGEKTLLLPAGEYAVEAREVGYFPVSGVRLRVVSDAQATLALSLASLHQWKYAHLLAGAFHHPAVADLDGDGKLETIVGGSLGNVHFLSATGTQLGPPAQLAGSIGGPPAIADLDGDGVPDLVVGTRTKRPDGGLVYAVSGKEGHAELWRRRGTDRVSATPAVGDVDGDGRPEVLYQGDPPNGKIVCVDAKDGSTRWEYPPRGGGALPAGAGAVLANLGAEVGLVVLAADECGGCTALAARDGRLLWRREGGGHGHMGGVRVVDVDGASPPEVVVAGALGPGDGRAALLCFSTRDGASRWERPTGEPVVGLPVVADWDGDGLPDFAVVTTGGKVLWVRGRDGVVLGEAQVKGPIGAGPGVGDLEGDGVPEVLVESQEGTLTALALGASERWTFKGAGNGLATPVVADVDGDGTPDVVAAFAGGVHCLRGSRRLLWSRPVPSKVHCIDVADADGDGVADVWAFAEQDRLYCFSGRDGEPLWDHTATLSRPIFALLSAGPGPAALSPVAVFGYGALHAVSGAPGLAPEARTIWERGMPEGANDQYPAIADLDGDGIADVVTGDCGGGVYAVSGKDRRLLWTATRLGLGGIESRPALADLDGDRVPDAVLATNQGKLFALSGRDGHLLWPAFELGSGCTATPAIADWDRDGTPDVMVTSGNRRTHFLSGRDGRPIRPFHEGRDDLYTIIGKRHGTPAIADVDGDGVADAVLTPGGGKVYFLNGATGEAREVSLKGAVQCGAAVAALIPGRKERQAVVGCTDGRVYCLSSDGRVLWWFGTGDWVDVPPLLRDLDGDGAPEVVAVSRDLRVYCLSGRASAAPAK
ncbi:MAG: VCBS repeat-containing protein [Planctomycetes bacterium]|nr:VCBS repeat-containing protein [Planctomycetota bacterium]